MSDLDNEDTNTLPVPSELDSLKARAKQMNIPFHPSISLEKLREKVNAAVTTDGPVAPDDTKAADAVAASKEAPVALVEETELEKLRRMRRDQTRLVRVRMTCLNPNKKDIEGEIISVGNNVVGTLKRYVPFTGADEGWHIPFIMYEVLRDRMCQIFVRERTGPAGTPVMRSKTIREFAIEILPDLTQEELNELARRQALAGSVDAAKATS
jgi:hypothetical protein